jgi:tetratricopeptide (TPR) repeat protein
LNIPKKLTEENIMHKKEIPREIPREIIEGLDSSVNESDIIEWVQIQSGMVDSWGQTNLLLTNTNFIAMNRNSFSDPWTFTLLDPLFKNSIKLFNYEESLQVKDFSGNEYSIQIVILEKDLVLYFLKVLSDMKNSLQSHKDNQSPKSDPNEDNPPLEKATKPATQNSDKESFLLDFNQLIDEIDAPMGDFTSIDIIEKVDSLANDAKRLGIPYGNDPFEQIGNFLETFFINQAESAIQMGATERIKLVENINRLKNRFKHENPSDQTTLSPKDKNDFKTHITTGKLLGKNKKTIPQAIISYKKALSINPDSPIANMETAHLLMEIDEYKKAINYFQIAIKQTDDSLIKRELLLKLSSIYSNILGEPEKADLFHSMAEKL